MSDRDGGELDAAPGTNATDAHRLLEVVCHDIRSPLASLLMGGDLLRRHLAKRDDLASESRILEAVLRSAERVRKLVADMHDVALSLRGNLPIALGSVDVAALLGDVSLQYAKLAPASRVRLDLDTPPAGETFPGDRALLVRAIGALLCNAVRYSPEESPVRVTFTRRPGRVELAVVDEGPGLPDDRLLHAFDHTWHATQNPRDGAGLGLALVRAIARAHGGDATVERRAPRGLRVALSLPSLAAEVSGEPENGDHEQDDPRR
jgi:signal transduction histidine kinase